MPLTTITVERRCQALPDHHLSALTIAEAHNVDAAAQAVGIGGYALSAEVVDSDGTGGTARGLSHLDGGRRGREGERDGLPE